MESYLKEKRNVTEENKNYLKDYERNKIIYYSSFSLAILSN